MTNYRLSAYKELINLINRIGKDKYLQGELLNVNYDYLLAH